MINSISCTIINLVWLAIAVFILNSVVCCLFDFDMVASIIKFFKTKILGESGKSKGKSDGNS